MKKAKPLTRKASEVDHIPLTINGKAYELGVGSRADQVDPAHTLAYTVMEVSKRGRR